MCISNVEILSLREVGTNFAIYLLKIMFQYFKDEEESWKRNQREIQKSCRV